MARKNIKLGLKKMAAYRQVQITKMSLANLQSKRSDADKKIQELKSDLVSETIIKNEAAKVDKAKLEIESLKEEISAQRNKREVSKSLMGTIVVSKEISQSAIDRIAVLRNQISSIEESISKSEPLVRNQAYLKSRIQNTEEWKTKVIARIATIENKEAKQQSLRNKAAESTKTKRQIAKGVKRSLADNEDCPYCGFTLTATIHADHIYPLAKGGESTKKNMVLVCADCNSKKSSLTLQAFIKKYSLDRDEIESHLEALGKDF